MRISLSPETAQRIREALGNDVDLAPDVVPSVLGRLAVEAPAVYSQVLAELSGSQIRLDSEDELRRRQRRGALRRLLFSWGEYETGVGDRLFAKRHIAAAVPLSIAALTLTFLAISLVFGHRTVITPAHRAAIIKPRDLAHQETTTPPAFVPRPYLPRQIEIGGLNSLPVGSLSRPSLGRMLPALSVPSALPGFNGASILAPRLGNPVVVSMQESPVRERAPSSPVVYNRSTDREGAQPEAASRPAPASSPQPALALGTRLQATLVTGAVVLPGGSPTPVVVETANPAGVWLGQAVLGPADRVQVTLVLMAQNRADAVRGVALDPAHLTPGLSGRTTTRHSSTAAAMATAALGAASDYAQAAAGQGGAASLDWWGVGGGGQMPSPWAYLAARVAQEFQARSAGSGGWVTTTEIPVGTPIVILVTGGP